jgi:hypothetical protein
MTRISRVASPLLIAITTASSGCFYFGGGGGVPDQGVTGPTHSSHMGGIVFSNELIVPGQEITAALGDHCVLGQGCYGALYLRKAVHNYTRSGGSAGMGKIISTVALRITVDGGQPVDGLFTMASRQSAGNFTLLRAESDDSPSSAHPRWFLENVAGKLAAGDHTLDLAVLPAMNDGTVTGQPIASGKLMLTVPDDARNLVMKAMRHEDKIKAAQSAGVETASSPPPASGGGGHVKLSNGCVSSVTFLFNGCGGDKKFVTVPAGGEKTIRLDVSDGSPCDVCIAKGGDCKMYPSMFTTSMSEASVSASGGCDSPATN